MSKARRKPDIGETDQGVFFASMDDLREIMRKMEAQRTTVVEYRGRCPFCVSRDARAMILGVTPQGYQALILCGACQARGPLEIDYDPLAALLRAQDRWNSGTRGEWYNRNDAPGGSSADPDRRGKPES